MSTVGVRDLWNHGGDALERVIRGEILVVSRDGTATAELRPLPRRSPSPAELVARRRAVPAMDLESSRRDLGEVLDPELWRDVVSSTPRR